MSSVIINNLKGIEECSYLELGVHNNKNFNAINAKEKQSVDMNGRAIFTGTTDEYFAQLDLSVKFDIIFIDANHDYDFVLRDFNNSVDRATKWILLHDMIPPTLEYTSTEKCSDSFKILYFLLKETNFEIYPMNNNYGFTLIRVPVTKISPNESYKTVSYDEFMNYIKDVKLYSDAEITEMLGAENV